MKTPFFSRLLVLATIFALACDNMDELDPGFNPDESNRTVRLVTAADKSTVMDVKMMFKNVRTVDLASCGGSHVNYISDRYVRFSDVAAKAAEFSFGLLHTNNSRTKVDVILARQDEAFTHASITNKEVLVVNLLNNPELNGYDPLTPGGAITVESSTLGDTHLNTNNVVIVASATEKLGNLVTMRYSPPAGFVGQVKFRYSITIDVENGLAPCNLPAAPEFYSGHDVVIDVSN